MIFLPQGSNNKKWEQLEWLPPLTPPWMDPKSSFLSPLFTPNFQTEQSQLWREDYSEEGNDFFYNTGSSSANAMVFR